MIDRYLLRYFIAVMDLGNFSRAAAQCGVSQPTLSVGIAKLEALLGRTLFLRTNRRVELTAAGSRIALYARRIEAEFAEAERAVRDDPPAKLIRIGVVSTLPAAWLERALREAHAEPGAGHIELVEGRMRDLARILDRGRVDTILGSLEGQSQDRVLFEEGYAVTMATTHPLGLRPSVSAEEIGGETMIVRRHCEALAETSRFFTSRGVRPFMAARTTNDERAIAYVRAGLGITVMPRCFLEPGVAMSALAGFEIRRSIGFRFAPDSVGRLAGSAMFERFAESIRDSNAQLERQETTPQ